MKQKLNLLTIALAIVFSATFISCDDDDENETNISAYNDTESHYMGDNCMTCHKSGGEGEGWFTVAGTSYIQSLKAEYPNATVKLYSGANGSGNLIATIEVDGYGNFFTTKTINLSKGVYPSITGTTGNTQYMPISTTLGACNSCHGSSTGKIWVD